MTNQFPGPIRVLKWPELPAKPMRATEPRQSKFVVTIEIDCGVGLPVRKAVQLSPHLVQEAMQKLDVCTSKETELLVHGFRHTDHINKVQAARQRIAENLSNELTLELVKVFATNDTVDGYNKEQPT